MRSLKFEHSRFSFMGSKAFRNNGYWFQLVRMPITLDTMVNIKIIFKSYLLIMKVEIEIHKIYFDIFIIFLT